MKYLFSGDIQYVEGRKRKRRHWKKVLVILLILAFVAFSACSFMMVHQTFDETFARAERPEYSYYQTYADIADNYSRTEVSFPSGDHQLKGYLYGSSKAKALVVISHGMGGGADDYLEETRYFVDHGYRVLGFDNTGSYDSEGEGIMGMSQSLIDLDAALTWVEKQAEFEDLPVLLYGHSWGGYATATILDYQHEITAVASVAGYNTPMEIITAWCKENMGFLTYIEYPYIWLYQKYLFGGESNLSAAKAINDSEVPVMLIHGSQDQVVDFDTVAIMAHRDEIENPHVLYKVCEQAGQNGHNNLLFSIESNAYQDELNAKYAALQQQYGKTLPEEIERAFYSEIDKAKTSQVNRDLMEEIDAFYQDAIKK